MTERKPGRMAKLGNEAFKEADYELKNDELQLLLKTNINWEELKPKVSNPELYAKLIKVVHEATQRNESISQLKERIQQIGKEGFDIAKQVIQLLK